MIRIAKYTLTALTTLLLLGCGHSGNEFTIEGEFAGMKNGALSIFTPADPNATIDTLKIEEGQFKYSGETYDTIPYIILFPNAVEQVVFVAPGKTINYSAATNDLKNYKVEGTDENELMTDFRKKALELKDDEVPTLARQFILDNPQSVVSLYLFGRYFAQNEKPDYKTTAELLKVLRTHHPTNLLLFAVEGMMKNAGAIAEGKKLKNVELTTQRKDKRKLWNKKDDDRYTFVFFWASWQRNSYDILFRIRNIQRDYADKVRFVGISLDNQLFRWEDLTRRDSLIIEHYCDGLSWSSPVVSELSLEFLPLYLIVDKSHKIIFKTDDLEKITDKIKKLK